MYCCFLLLRTSTDVVFAFCLEAALSFNTFLLTRVALSPPFPLSHGGLLHLLFTMLALLGLKGLIGAAVADHAHPTVESRPLSISHQIVEEVNF